MKKRKILSALALSVGIICGMTVSSNAMKRAGKNIAQRHASVREDKDMPEINFSLPGSVTVASRDESNFEMVDTLSRATSPALLSQESRAEKKERLLREYIPDLSEFQSVSFAIEGTNGKKTFVKIPVAAHFRDRERREKIVIYNSQLPDAFKFFRSRLQSEYDKSEKQRKIELDKSWLPNFLFPEVRFPSKKSFIDFADSRKVLSGPEAWLEDPNAPQHNMEGLMNVCMYLRHVMNFCGTGMENSLTPCAFIIDVQAVKDCDTIRPWIERMDTPLQYYKAVEEGFYEIANSSLSNTDMVIALDRCLDEFLHRLNPRASDKQAIDFCFALSRVDYYLSRLEKCKWNKTPEELEVMNMLRKKVEALYIEHRFMFVRSEAPILNIPVDYAQVIAKGDDRNIIFIDRTEMQERFIKRIEDALDTRVTSLTRQFEFSPRSRVELRNLANELHPQNYQEMLDKMQEQILDLQEEEARLKATAEAEKAKVALKVTETGIRLGIAAYTGGASEVLNSVSNRLSPQSNQSDLNYTEKDVKDYIDEENRLKSEQQTMDIHTFLSQTNFDNPRNIVVDSISTTETPSAPIDYGMSMEPVIIRKPNLTAIGKVIEENGLKPEDVDSLLQSMNYYLRSLNITGKIKLRQSQRELMQHIRDGEVEYQNLFSLYIKLLRHNFPERTDFTGAIIDERRPNSDGQNALLREYFVYEVRKLESDL